MKWAIKSSGRENHQRKFCFTMPSGSHVWCQSATYDPCIFVLAFEKAALVEAKQPVARVKEMLACSVSLGCVQCSYTYSSTSSAFCNGIRYFFAQRFYRLRTAFSSTYVVRLQTVFPWSIEIRSLKTSHDASMNCCKELSRNLTSTTPSCLI